MHRFSLVALLALVALANATVYRSLYFGVRESGDVLIGQEEVHESYFPLTVVKKNVLIAGDGENKITRIEIISLKIKEETATPLITSGGLGKTHVNVEFTSKRGHGIHYLVKVYGKRKP